MNEFERHYAGLCKEYLGWAHRCQRGDLQACSRLEDLAFGLEPAGIEADPTGRNLEPALSYLAKHGLADDTAQYERDKSRLSKAVKEAWQAGRLAEAAEMLDQICALISDHFGEFSERLDPELLVRATAYRHAGALDRAEVLYLEAIDRLETYRGPDCSLLTDCRDGLAEVFSSQAAARIRQGRFREAEECFHKALDLAAQVHGLSSLAVAVLASDLAELCTRMGALEKAAEWGTRAQALLQALFPDSAEIVAYGEGLDARELDDYFLSWSQLAMVFARLRETSRAEQILYALKAAREATQGPDAPETLRVINDLVELFFASQRPMEAEPLLQELSRKARAVVPADSLEYARVLASQATLEGFKGDFGKALAYGQQGLEIKLQHLGRHPEVVIGMNNLAELHRKLGQFEAAETYFRQALDILNSAFADGHPEQAICLSNLGDLLEEVGRLREAEQAQRNALAIQKRFFPQDSGKTASVLRSLGSLCMAQAQFAEAREYFDQAIEIRRAHGEERTLDYAQDLSHLAGYFQAIGELAQARETLDEVRRLRTQFFDPQVPAHADGLLAMAELQASTGDYQSARENLNHLLEIRRKTLGEHHPDLGRIHCQMAFVEFHAGRHSSARLNAEKAVEILAKIEFGHPEMCSAMLVRAEILHLTGQLEEAIDDCRWVCEGLHTALGADHPRCANAHLTLAIFLQSANDPEAEQHYQEALRAFQTTFGDAHPSVATTRLHLANLYRFQDQLTDAQVQLESALNQLQKTLGEDHFQYVSALQESAYLLLETDQFDEAERRFEQARGTLENRYADYHHRMHAGCLHGLGRIHAQSQRYPSAHELLLASLRREDVVIDDVMGAGTEQQRLSVLGDSRDRLNELLAVTEAGLLQDPEALRETFEVLLSRKTISVELFARQRSLALETGDPRLLKMLDELDQARRTLAGMELAGLPRLLSDDELASLPDRSIGVGMNTYRFLDYEIERRTKEQLENRLWREFPELMELGKARRAAAARVIEAIPQDAALIEFVCFRSLGLGLDQPAEDRYGAFVASARVLNPVWVGLGPAERIDSALDTFRIALLGHSEGLRDLRQGTGESAQLEGLGLPLRQLLIDPLLPCLEGVKRLFIAPDGHLANLPFEVLPDPKGQLIDRFEISYLNCGRELVDFSRPLAGNPEESVVMADPAYELDAGVLSDLPDEPMVQRPARSRRPVSAEGFFALLGESPKPLDPLPGARKEGEFVAAALGVECLSGASVCDARVKQLESPAIFHLATHGQFLKRERAGKKAASANGGMSSAILSNPLLRSGLALAGFNNALRDESLPQQIEDGVLTAEDVTSLNLTNTQLVVLSACSTGIGEPRSGEGIFGLRRAFAIAGARALILSLWKVPDEATRILMEEFYRRLLAGRSRADALRRARLAVRANPEFSSPQFWGGFILVGDPGPLSQGLDSP